MKIDLSTVDRIAHLARLSFEGKEREQILVELNRMIAFCDQLESLDTSGVEPLVYMVDEHNRMREDIVQQEISKEDALKNAPKKDSDYFRVPKVIGDSE